MKKYFLPSIVGLLIIVIGYLGWQNWQLQQNQPDVQNQKLLTKISEHLLLPTGETPTIAIIQDVDKLKAQQSFFNNAINGDHLLIYSQAGKAIIYRSDDDLIVNVGPLNFAADGADTINGSN